MKILISKQFKKKIVLTIHDNFVVYSKFNPRRKIFLLCVFCFALHDFSLFIILFVNGCRNYSYLFAKHNVYNFLRY